jgi:hypothetical protein
VLPLPWAGVPAFAGKVSGCLAKNSDSIVGGLHNIYRQFQAVRKNAKKYQNNRKGFNQKFACKSFRKPLYWS